MAELTPALREEISFHKEMVRRLKREIALVDRNSRRKYIRDFDEEYSTYEQISSLDDLIMAAYQADIIYIGDYHALRQSQVFVARMVKEIASRTRKVRLGMEMVFGRNQRVLDRWMEGEIDEDEFLTRIRYHLDWGYDWESFRQILDAARKYKVPVLALDCEPRSGFRYIRKRDQYAAQRIAAVVESDPHAKIIVVFGESHLASGHLPERVRAILKARSLERRDLVIVQNVEQIYWDLAEGGHQHVDVVRCSPSSYCVFNASPLAKYESYRQTIDRWKAESVQDTGLDLTPTIYNMVDTILRFLRLDKYRYRLQRDGSSLELLVDAYPEVYSDMELDQFQDVLRASNLNPEQMAEVTYHVGRNGSCYVPSINAIFIGDFNLVHGGEEAAHFVNMALKGEIFERGGKVYPAADLFYVTVLEEAIGFFGSKLIDPSRNHFFETEFYRYHKKSPAVIERETRYGYREFRDIIDFILLHKRFERSYHEYEDVPARLLDGINAEGERFSILTHELGYFLGQQIYDGYHAGSIRRREVVKLFQRSFEPGGEALSVYLDLVERLSVDESSGEAS
ncbi:MAG: hypothetical protein E2P04_01030 [Acidobacteria bacterium]|nr:MAG: hypothetical protein E2P04_01030 [Acidobacteriota bacterium]